ncbi:WD40 repeat-containing protein [Beggiatoa alba B18LD]|uniref:WD40 repeat-containing protein n=1 Tax=Beggiatoa alba B18LD TaxID=395493 RepID=I3CBW8_9GAMM|nr:WD40 repeat domain-containing protein [Beggiatoa alba]EIJ41111.1 WD40 repeat-containing protein [Beggiatoa alba B18LD]
MELPHLTLFITTPNDVSEERVIIERVVQRLAETYANQVCLISYFSVTPDSIKHEILPTCIDVYICVLWSQLGERPKSVHYRADGSQYATSVEYEFETALANFQSMGKPDMLIYRKTLEPPFLQNSKATDFNQRMAQKERTDNFCNYWSQQHKSTQQAIFQPFDNLAFFEQHIEEYLRHLLASKTVPCEEKALTINRWTHGSPFRGLHLFEEQHAPIFFGRTQAVGEIIQYLRKQAQEKHPFIMVLGMSGCGKSSLVRAGVIPLLTQPNVIEGVSAWRKAVLRPSDFSNDLALGLAIELLVKSALPTLTPYDTQILLNLLRLAEKNAITRFINDRLVQAAKLQRLAHNAVHLLLFVDQFEEIFTLEAISSSDRIAFIQLLTFLVSMENVWVISTMRSDFYHRCAELPALVRLMEGHGHYLLTPPSLNELSQIIRLPALAAGLHFAELPEKTISLDEVLLEAIGDNPENLALLEFTLERLYEQRNAQGGLTYEAYQRIGGLEGALAQHAEMVFNQVSPAAQACFPNLMRTLVTVAKNGDVPVLGQRFLYDDHKTPEPLKELLHALTQARLLVTGETENKIAFARIAHEALLHHWPRLLAWWHEDRHALQVRARVKDAAIHWQNEGKLPDLLLPEGKLLIEAEDLLIHWQDALLPETIDYIQASSLAVQQRQHQHAEQARKRLQRSHYIALLFAGLSVLALLAGLFAYYQAQLATAQARAAELAKQRAESSEQQVRNALAQAEQSKQSALVAKNQAQISEGLALQAKQAIENIEQTRTTELFESHLTHAALLARVEDYQTARKVLTDASYLNNSVAPSRRHLFTLLDWFVQQQSNPAQLQFQLNTPINAIALSPDTRWLAVASTRGIIHILDANTGKVMQILQAHQGDIQSLVFEPHGEWLASAGHDQKVILWTRQNASPPAQNTWQILREWDAGYKINALAVSPDGQFLASAGRELEHSISLWSVTDAHELRRFKGHTGRIPASGLAFSPDGTLLASASFDKTARLWEVATGKRIRLYQGHTQDVEAIRFSPNGQYVITASSDKTLRLWSIKNDQSLNVLSGHQNSILDVVFLPEGRRVLSASRDRTLRLWDIDSGVSLQVWQGHNDSIASLSLQNNIVFSGGRDGTIQRWQLQDKPNIHTVHLPSEPTSVLLLPENQQVVIGFATGVLQVYSLITGNLLNTLEKAHIGRIQQLIRIQGLTNKNGEWFASAGAGDGFVRLWRSDAQGFQLQQTVFDEQTKKAVYALAENPQRKQLATGHYDGEVRLLSFDANEAEIQHQWQAQQSVVTSLMFHPNGQQLLTTGKEGNIRLWTLLEDKPVLRTELPSEQQTTVYNAIFDPMGQSIVSVGDSASVYLYETTNQQLVQRLIGHENSILKALYLPDPQQLITLSSDASIRFWDISENNELFSLRLPSHSGYPIPMWDMDFQCMAQTCWLAVPLTRGELLLYKMGRIY